MEFLELCKIRESCRDYDPTRQIDEETLNKILEAARLSPSACNGQPYHITVCQGESARAVAKATQGMGMNKFASDSPTLVVISEEKYVKTAALGSKVKGIDYRSIDIGILSAHLTLAAASLGVHSCILGWLDSKDIEETLSLSGKVHLVITLGYPKKESAPREKKRKSMEELVSFK